MSLPPKHKWLLLYLALAAAIMTGLTWTGVKITSDSRLYLMGADLLSQGDMSQAKKILTWRPCPIGYPIILTCMEKLVGGQMGITGVVIESDRSHVSVFVNNPTDKLWDVQGPDIIRNIVWARAVSVVGFMMTVAGMYLWGYKFGGTKVAHFSTWSLLICLPVVHLFTGAWTEVMFVPMSLFSLYFIHSYSRDGGRKNLFLSAIFTLAAFAIRHIGIVFVMVGLWYVLQKDIRMKSWWSLPWLILVLLPLAWYLQLSAERSWATAGLKQAGEFVRVLATELGVLIVVLIFLWRQVRAKIWSGLWLAIILQMSVLMALSWYNWVSAADTNRYLASVYPFIIITLASVLSEAVASRSVSREY
ncbi:MAG: hypothetical protein ABII96_03650 [Candidatus Zixiibacteriota bacterium]